MGGHPDGAIEIRWFENAPNTHNQLPSQHWGVAAVPLCSKDWATTPCCCPGAQTELDPVLLDPGRAQIPGDFYSRISLLCLHKAQKWLSETIRSQALPGTLKVTEERAEVTRMQSWLWPVTRAPQQALALHWQCFSFLNRCVAVHVKTIIKALTHDSFLCATYTSIHHCHFHLSHT